MAAPPLRLLSAAEYKQLGLDERRAYVAALMAHIAQLKAKFDSAAEKRANQRKSDPNRK